MDTLKRHEVFEIEVLDKLKSAKMLEPLVFGGGTMLRLCHELSRYSIDLDFWFLKKREPKAYFKKLKSCLGRDYEITDAAIKFYTILIEVRSKMYPMRLKLEISKSTESCDTEERIAFTRYSNKQVMLRVKTLEQIMKNKMKAAIDRREIRDCFDIEFMLRRGIGLLGTKKELSDLKALIAGFKARDYAVTLGSVLEPKDRRYYSNKGFEYLLEKIDSRL